MQLTHFIVKSICSYLIFLAGIALVVFAGTQTTLVATKIVLGGYSVLPTDTSYGYSYNPYSYPTALTNVSPEDTPENQSLVREYNTLTRAYNEKSDQQANNTILKTTQFDALLDKYDAAQERTGGYPDLAKSLTLLILGVAVLLLGRKLIDELKNS